MLPVLAGLALWLAASCGSDTKPTPTGPDEDTPTLVAQALPAFKAASTKTWPTPTARMVQIHRTMAAGDFKTARGLLQQEITAHPDNDEAHYLIGEIQCNRARFGVANAAFEKVLRDGPTFQGCNQALYYYGICQMRLGNAALAREALLAILELHPSHGEALFALGMLDVQQGKPKLAIVFFEEAIYSFQDKERKGRNRSAALARTYCGLADAHLQTDNPEQAKLCLENGLRLDPDNPKSHYALSRVLHRLGDSEGAAREMAEFQRLNVDQKPNQPADGSSSTNDAKR